MNNRSGKPLTEKHRENISKGMMGLKNNLGKHWKWSHSISLNGRENMSKARKGKTPTLGKHWKLSEITKEKMSKSKRGEKGPGWRGGISKEGYPFNFNKELKLLIRKRDNYACQFPDCGKRENGRTHDVHHIDYDKNNLDPKNLITLCLNHNIKVNSNREYWKGYFRKM